MQRFYLNNRLDTELNITEESFFKQISIVLRSRLGDSIILFNGDGFNYEYKIVDISKKGIKLFLTKRTNNSINSKVNITLYQALPNKYEKIEYIFQKGVEVGIDKFIFFISDRSSQIKLHAHKIKRFHNIAKEALEQCGGNTFPEIEFTQNLLKLQKHNNNNNIVANIHSKGKYLKDMDFSKYEKSGINIWVGPEGGWSKEEIDYFDTQQFISIYLGNRILRTETVGEVLAFYINNSF